MGRGEWGLGTGEWGVERKGEGGGAGRDEGTGGGARGEHRCYPRVRFERESDSNHSPSSLVH